jgi:hypothetical protein
MRISDDDDEENNGAKTLTLNLKIFKNRIFLWSMKITHFVSRSLTETM